MKYYIYHIPEIKIGCSTEPENRVKAQGYTNYEILEEHEDIKVASDRERELQKEYGYKVDKVSYYQSYESRKKGLTFENRSKGGKAATLVGGQIKGGKISGKISGKIVSARIHTCPHCGKTGKSNAMFQWHFENCKLQTEKN